MNKLTKPSISEEQRGISVVELLFAFATVGVAVVVGAMSDPKLPPSLRD